ncbi:MAG TPA: 50S ribosomal protein L3 [Solirubrobacterales bacterium]|nr:50S ribosomal protein L3 [Solirubrobacterales bacterium]HZK15984.1 50S ribosomal protein L3 [Solirubrobacterales bacterium]
MSAILGKKLGMTQVFEDDGTVVPVTVVEAGPCKVTAVRQPDRDGYAAVQLAFDRTQQRKLTRAELGHLAKASAPPMRSVVEFRDEDLGDGEGGGEGGGPKVGDDVTVEQFEAGQKVKVAGTSIGKGFQGTVKRHNFSRGPVSHGSHNVRAPGSIGAAAFPARVFKGMRMPGRMGGKRTTQKGLSIHQVDAERNLLLIKGSVPGSRNSILEIRTDG